MNYNKFSDFVIKKNFPNYIPVKNRYDFEYDIYAYYNEYYATPYETQQRRIMRNYLSNQQDIKKSNKNFFKNDKTKIFNFLYTNGLTYMIIEDKMKNVIQMFILINKIWCPFKRFSNKDECNKFITYIKTNALKSYP
jgi:hypothetical protein